MKEILALVEHGCKVIQVDEPVLMRKPQEAIDYGVQDLAACFKGSKTNDDIGSYRKYVIIYKERFLLTYL